MKMKNRLCLSVAVVGLLASMDVAAQSLADHPAAGGTATPGYPPGKMRLGLNLIPTPLGRYETSNQTGTGTLTGDLSFAFGVRAFFDYLITPNFFIGVGPTYTFNVVAKEQRPGATARQELDLLVRMGAGAPVSDSLQLYGYLSPGYSLFFNSGSGDAPEGFVLGINAGGMYTVNQLFFLNGEVGYQLGFQKVTIMTTDVDFSVQFLQIALGGGVRL